MSDNSASQSRHAGPVSTKAAVHSSAASVSSRKPAPPSTSSSRHSNGVSSSSGTSSAPGSDRKRKHTSSSSKPPSSSHHHHHAHQQQKQKMSKRLRHRKDHVSGFLDMQHRRKLFPKSSEFLCPVRFRNRLPDIPFEPKLAKYPHEPERFIKYKPNSLEFEYEYELHMEPNLGLTIDIVDPDNRRVRKNEPMPEEDTKLLEMKDLSDKKGESRSEKVRPAVTWLRRTEYMGNDLYQSVHKFKTQSSIQEEMSKKLKDELQNQAISPIEKAEATFNDLPHTIKDLKHPHDKSLTVKQSWDLFPDETSYGEGFAILEYDMLPSVDMDERDAVEKQNKAMLRGVRKVDGIAGLTSLVGSLFLPKSVENGTASSRYRYFRDYNLNVKNNEHYMFLINPDSNVAHYGLIPSKFELKKKKVKAKDTSNHPMAVIERRALTQDEIEDRKSTLTSVGGIYRDPRGNDHDEENWGQEVRGQTDESRDGEDGVKKEQSGSSPAREVESDTQREVEVVKNERVEGEDNAESRDAEKEKSESSTALKEAGQVAGKDDDGDDSPQVSDDDSSGSGEDSDDD